LRRNEPTSTRAAVLHRSFARSRNVRSIVDLIPCTIYVSQFTASRLSSAHARTPKLAREKLLSVLSTCSPEKARESRCAWNVAIPEAFFSILASLHTRMNPCTCHVPVGRNAFPRNKNAGRSDCHCESLCGRRATPRATLQLSISSGDATPGISPAWNANDKSAAAFSAAALLPRTH